MPVCGGQERLREGGHKAHPTQKPEALLYRVLLATTEKGDVVLDPFFGTGTTGAVAKRLGREWIGCEREPAYREVATKRIEKELPLDESALATMASPRTQPKVAFGSVVEAGLLPPGTQVFDKNRRWTATVRADGSLLCGTLSGSIHGLGKDLQGAPSCNGWAFWHYDAAGEFKPIDTVRQTYLLSVEDLRPNQIISSSPRQRGPIS
jgi:modification methylase